MTQGVSVIWLIGVIGLSCRAGGGLGSFIARERAPGLGVVPFPMAARPGPTLERPPRGGLTAIRTLLKRLQERPAFFMGAGEV